MTAVEKKIIIENVNMLDLLGFNDSNLRLLEDRFNTSITVRGDNVVLKGVIEEVELIERVLKEMAYVLNTSGRLGTNDVNTILDLTIEGKEIVDEDELDTIVLYTKKDVIKARTPGQINYINLARKNDICLGGRSYGQRISLEDDLVRDKIRDNFEIDSSNSLGFDGKQTYYYEISNNLNSNENQEKSIRYKAKYIITKAGKLEQLNENCDLEDFLLTKGFKKIKE